MLSLLALLCACAEEPESVLAPSMPAEVEGELSSLLAEIVDTPLPSGTTMTVSAPDWGVWTATAGVASVDPEEPVTSEHLFPVASLTKSFTAALIHREIEAGAFTLDTPVAELLPELGMDPSVQVQHLLEHTSGLVDYSSIEGYSEASADEAEPAELVAMALSQPLAVEPGTELHYSNTNYIVAGMVLEASTGLPYVEQLRGELLDPLGLGSAALKGEEELPGPLVDSHQGSQPYAEPHPDWTWSASGMATESRTACEWLGLLLEPGTVLSEASLEAVLERPERASGGLSPFGRGVKIVDAGGLEVAGYAAATGGSGGFAYLHRPTGT